MRGILPKLSQTNIRFLLFFVTLYIERREMFLYLILSKNEGLLDTKAIFMKPIEDGDDVIPDEDNGGYIRVCYGTDSI